MKNIVFISDFFLHHVNGGAEIYDNVLIEELKKKYQDEANRIKKEGNFAF